MGALSANAFDNSTGFLLDTHTFIWALKQPKRLGEQARRVIEDTESRLFLSSISASEITNKHRLGRLDETYSLVVEAYAEYAKQLGIEDLPVTLAHAYLAGSMDWEHRDPFDRMLVAQASLENLAIITNDSMISSHPWVDVIW